MVSQLAACVCEHVSQGRPLAHQTDQADSNNVQQYHSNRELNPINETKMVPNMHTRILFDNATVDNATGYRCT